MSQPKTRTVKTGLSPLAKALLVIGALVVLGGGGGGYLWFMGRQAEQNQQATAAALVSTQQAATEVANAATSAAQIAATATSDAWIANLERLYQTAAALENAGDLRLARTKYQELVSLEPGFRDVAERLRMVSEKLAESLYQDAIEAANQKLWAEAVAKFDQVSTIIPGYKDTATRRAAAMKELNATATPTVRPTASLRPTDAATATLGNETPTVAASVTGTPAASGTPSSGASATGVPAGNETSTPGAAVAVVQAPVPRPPQTSDPRPSGDWSVRTYNTDDVAVVLVNGKLVAGSLYGNLSDSGWAPINDYLVGGDNEIIVASWNSAYDRSWGFGIRRNDTQVWGSEQTPIRAPVGMNYVQRLRITAAGEVEPIEAEQAAPKPPPGKWYVRVQGAQDIGIVLVNGTPVVLNSLAFSQDSGWIEITGQLSNERGNTVHVMLWNFEGASSFNYLIKRDETIVWGQSGASAGTIGAAYNTIVTISPEGRIEHPPIQGGITQQAWAVRTYNTDDVAVVLVNGKLVAGSLYGNLVDSNWVKINDYLIDDEDNDIVVASWNSAYDRSWGFGVRRNDTQVWGIEQTPIRAPVGMNYVQRLRITAAGEVEPVEPENAAPKPPPGKWYVRVQGAQDIGIVLVNGTPVVLNALAFSQDSGWIEITGQLSSERDNTIVVQAWNFEGPYNYKFDIKRDEIIVWGAEKNGGGQIGTVLDQTITVTTRGEIAETR